MRHRPQRDHRRPARHSLGVDTEVATVSMKVALLSDIHANEVALAAVLAEASAA